MHCKAWRQLNSTDSWPGAGLPWLGFGSLGSQLVVVVVVFDALTLLRYPWTLWAAAGNAGGGGLRHLFTHQYEYFLYRLCEIYIFACLLVRQAHLHFSLYFLSFFLAFFRLWTITKKSHARSIKMRRMSREPKGGEARRGEAAWCAECAAISFKFYLFLSAQGLVGRQHESPICQIKKTRHNKCRTN